MKKFTKIFLLTAIILLVIGCVFCATFGVMGGFGQLSYLNGNTVHWGKWGKIGNYVLKYSSFWYDDWREDFYGELHENLDEDLREEWDLEMNTISASTESAVQTNYKASDIGELDIELGGENLIIARSETDYIQIANNTGNSNIKYGLDGRTFELYSSKRHNLHWGVKVPRGNICLYLPDGMNLDSIELEVGAGRLESIALEADEINIDAGAGNFIIEGIQAREVDISVGAGDSNINSIVASEADISVGAGSISAKGVDVSDISLEVGMGKIDMEGRISREADLECGMGSINMKLSGAETDYNYKVECAMGSVRIGSSKYSGMASERIIDNGSVSIFDVECSMGAVNIDFE